MPNEIGPRSLLWLFPSQEHRLVYRTADVSYYVAVFKPCLIRACCHLPRYAELAQREAHEVHQAILDPGTFAFIRTTMDSLMEEAPDVDLLNRETGFGVGSDFRFRHGDPDFLNAGLHFLLITCWRHHIRLRRKHHPAMLHPAVSRALDLLCGSAEASELDLVRLARLSGASPAHLSRLFKKQVGVSISHYRNSVRLGRFLQRMQAQPRPTLMQAMVEAGFGSYAQFHRVYCDSFGEAPGRSLRSRFT